MKKVIYIITFFCKLFKFYYYESILPSFKLTKGNGCLIEPTATFRKPENIKLGNNVLINHNCSLWSTQHAKIIIGNDVLFGPGVKIFTANHGIKIGKKINLQKWNEKNVIIGNNVWIGANAVILKGVVIEDGCIVGAGSIVTKRLFKNGVYTGNPAKLLKLRV